MVKYRIIRFLAYFIEVIVFYVINNAIPFFYFGSFLAKPTFLLPIIFTIAALEGPNIALGFSFFVGVLLDISYGGALGFNVVLVPLLSIAIGLIFSKVLKTSFLSTSLVAIGFLSLYFLFHYLFFYLRPMYTHQLYALYYNYLPRFLYTALFIPPFYLFNKSFYINIRSKEELF